MIMGVENLLLRALAGNLRGIIAFVLSIILSR